MELREKVIIEFEMLTKSNYDDQNNKHKLVLENMVEWKENNGQCEDYPETIKRLIKSLTKNVKFF